MAIASMILGIAAASTSGISYICWLNCTNFVAVGMLVFMALGCGVAGLILGAMNRDTTKAGMANVGKLLSIIALPIATINMFTCIGCYACYCADPWDYVYGYTF